MNVLLRTLFTGAIRLRCGVFVVFSRLHYVFVCILTS